MQAVLGACLLWALFSTGASLTCEFCLNLTGPCLESNPLVCEPDEDSCFDFLAQMNIFGNFNANFKGCAPAKNCVPGTYRTTTEGNESLQAILNCCNTDSCNNATGSLPTNGSFLPNGLACPACYILGEEDCEPEETILCTGEETMCIFITGDFDLSNTAVPLKSKGALRGCTTPLTCQALGENIYEVDNGEISYNITDMECTNAIRAAKNAINGTVPSVTPLPGK